MLGNGPAVLTWQIGQQAEYQAFRSAAGLYPGETAGDPGEQPIDGCSQQDRFYAVPHGHREVI
jgi:hypothetical protein